MSRPGAKAAAIKLLKVDGIHAPVEIRRHPTARRLTLRISRTQRCVVLTIPRNSDFREADRFLARSIDWVRERLEGVPEPLAFATGAVIPLRGTPHKIIFAGPRPGSPSPGGSRADHTFAFEKCWFFSALYPSDVE